MVLIRGKTPKQYHRDNYEKNKDKIKAERKERYERERIEKYELVIITGANDYTKPISVTAWNNIVKHIQTLERKVRKLEKYTY